MTKQDHNILKEVARFHKDWLMVCNTFVGKQNSKDIVQDMYIKLYDNGYLNKIKYKDTINKYFVYLTLRNMCFDFLRKRKQMKNIETIHLTEEKDESYKAMDLLFEKIHKEVSKWHSYDARLFELYFYSGLSYRDIAHGTDKIPRLIAKDKEISRLAAKRGTKIGVNTIFNTINKCKKKLHNALHEDFEDFFNGQFELIRE